MRGDYGHGRRQKRERKKRGPWAGTGSRLDPIDWCSPLSVEEIFVF